MDKISRGRNEKCRCISEPDGWVHGFAFSRYGAGDDDRYIQALHGVQRGQSFSIQGAVKSVRADCKRKYMSNVGWGAIRFIHRRSPLAKSRRTLCTKIFDRPFAGSYYLQSPRSNLCLREVEVDSQPDSRQERFSFPSLSLVDGFRAAE